MFSVCEPGISLRLSEILSLICECFFFFLMWKIEAFATVLLSDCVQELVNREL